MQLNPSDFEIFITSDGSPTLKSLTSPQAEPMHNKSGAFSETEFIYGRAIHKAFADCEHPKFLSLGLGLGYNEMLIACMALAQKNSPQIEIESYESSLSLREFFNHWLQNHSQNIYSEVEKFYQNKFQVDCKKYLNQLFQEQKFRLYDELNEKTITERKFNCILYDAFSSQTSPELWSEDFIDQFIQKFCAEKCIWSTYASTGNLKRALKKNGFTILSTEGFSNKRESTFAAR